MQKHYLLCPQALSLEVENHKTHVTITQDEGETSATIKINVINVYEGAWNRVQCFINYHIVSYHPALKTAGSCPTTPPPSCTTTTTNTATITICTTPSPGGSDEETETGGMASHFNAHDLTKLSTSGTRIFPLVVCASKSVGNNINNKWPPVLFQVGTYAGLGRSLRCPSYSVTMEMNLIPSFVQHLYTRDQWII